jgi:hypothetical protein
MASQGYLIHFLGVLIFVNIITYFTNHEICKQLLLKNNLPKNIKKDEYVRIDF